MKAVEEIGIGEPYDGASVAFVDDETAQFGLDDGRIFRVNPAGAAVHVGDHPGLLPGRSLEQLLAFFDVFGINVNDCEVGRLVEES